MANDLSASTLAEEMRERVADILILVADIGAGDYGARLTLDMPEESPLASLYAGINEMAASLERAHVQAQEYAKQLEEKLATIETQRTAIAELSTPIIEIWRGVLCLPVVGVLDSTRSGEMMERLLGAIVSQTARGAIIDITGIQVVDTATADHFLRMARAVRLLGAECVLTGINPSIAQTIIGMGVDLGGIATYRSLRDALQHYIRRAA